MKTSDSRSNIDYRLLGLMSDLLICSKCLRAGKVTPIPQILSQRHIPRSLCRSCARPDRETLRRSIARLVHI